MSRLPSPDDSRALFIGVDQFVDLEDLPAVRRNLSTLADLFAEDAWGLGSSHCTQLLNPSSTREVDDAIFRTADAASDTLLLYYAGHGLLDRQGRLHLAMPDSNMQAVHSTAFPYEWIRMRLGASSARRCVVVLDCCFSARAMGIQSTVADMVELAEAEGTYVLAAAAENAVALAPPGEEYTAFTGALVSVLNEGMESEPQILDLNTVFRGIQSILRQQSRPDPQCLARNHIGRMAFAKNRAYRPEPSEELRLAPGLPAAMHDLHTARSLADTLQTVADGSVNGLGYELASVHLVRTDGDLVVAALSGNTVAEMQINGRVGPREAWEQRLKTGEAWGELRFVPHSAARLLDEDGVPEWLDDGQRSYPEGGWHPADRLFAPLYTPSGAGGMSRELIGVISVSHPRSGLRPNEKQREALQAYAFHAAVALSNARLRANMQRALVRLEREQQALRASEESFRQAFEHAPSGVVVMETGGDASGRIIRSNDALCRLLGRPASAMHRYSLIDLVHPEDVGPMLRTFTEGGRVDLRLGKRNGTYVWVSLRHSIIADAADGPRFLLTHVEDIEERKCREFQLLHQINNDALTGLRGQARFRGHLNRLLRKSGHVLSDSKVDQVPPQDYPAHHVHVAATNGDTGDSMRGLGRFFRTILRTR